MVRSNLDRQDLIQAGMIGLWDAIDKYSGNQNCSFNTYANIRIRGNILDTVRKYSPVPKRYGNYKDIKFLEMEEEHHPTVNLDVDSFDLYRAIDKLPVKRKRILKRYLEGHGQEANGVMEGMSGGRISQILKEIVIDLREGMMI